MCTLWSADVRGSDQRPSLYQAESLSGRVRENHIFLNNYLIRQRRQVSAKSLLRRIPLGYPEVGKLVLFSAAGVFSVPKLNSTFPGLFSAPIHVHLPATSLATICTVSQPSEPPAEFRRHLCLRQLHTTQTSILHRCPGFPLALHLAPFPFSPRSV